MIEFTIYIDNTVYTLDIEKSDIDGLSFSYDNLIFGFDNIKLSRSQSFKVPRTGNNERILSFSARPDSYGNGMRQAYSASMRYSAGSEEGELFITGATKTHYEALFVYGELLPLTALKNAGNIANIVTQNPSIVWSDTTPYSNTAYAPKLGLVRYRVPLVNTLPRNGWNYMPTASVNDIITDVLSTIGVAGIDYGADLDYVRALGIKLNGTNTDEGEIGTYIFSKIGINVTITSGADTYLDTTARSVGLVAYQVPRFKQDVRANIKFEPNDNMVGFFIRHVRDGATIARYVTLASPGVVGTIITGKVDFKQGDLLIAESEEYGENNSNRYVLPVYTASMIVLSEQADSNITYPGAYYRNPNLPDVTALDLLKSISALIGKPFYLDSSTIRFFDFNFGSTYIDITDRVISIKSLKRTIGDYAQKNIVKFNSSDTVDENDRLELSYSIDNKSLQKEKELFTIPFSEGSSEDWAIYLKRQIVAYDIIEEDGTFSFGNDDDILASVYSTMPGVQDSYLVRPEFIEVQNYLELFAQSTTYEITAKLYLYEFNNIKHDTQFKIENNVYIVFSATWQKNIATLTLVKRF